MLPQTYNPAIPAAAQIFAWAYFVTIVDMASMYDYTRGDFQFRSK